MTEMWAGRASRHIVARLVVECDLRLQTPAHFGNGDGDGLTDMPLLRDPRDEAEGLITPLLTGASLAGALRSYLRAKERGYRQPLPVPPSDPRQRAQKRWAAAERGSLTVALFGGFKRDDEGLQSPLIVDDARGEGGGFELRDGVALDPRSRTAAEDKKFDLQLWPAGTVFKLRFELCLRAGQRLEDDHDRLRQALGAALAGLTDGGITLGARKQRGYGRVLADNWRVKTYDLRRADGLLDWLKRGGERLQDQGVAPIADLAEAFGANAIDQRSFFHLTANFALNGSLLIRAGIGASHFGPDDVHLHALQANGERKPVLSGTSVAGALRARASKILNPLRTEVQAQEIVDEIWGADMEKVREPRASRLKVSEHVITGVERDLVQSRASIDRFTGGARETALFNQQPVFGQPQSDVTIELQLIDPRDYEIGLLLLLLKDLWTGDLPLGGESSVGRGRLRGRAAVLKRKEASGTAREWTLRAPDELSDEVEVSGGDRAELEVFVAALHRQLREGTA